MSSAQLDTRPHLFDEPAPEIDPADPTALRQQVAERLAAHRARRPRPATATPSPTPINSPARARAARIAATVAERYTHSESYRSFLAAEAETAIRQAEAAAEVAAVTARAVTAAQLDLLESLDQAALDQATLDQAAQHQAASEPQTFAPQTSGHEALDQLAHNQHPTVHHHPRSHSTHKPTTTPEPSLSFPFQNESAQPASQLQSTSGITIRLYEEAPPTFHQPIITSTHPAVDPLDPESHALDEEIAFRQSPTFEDIIPPTEIPANLIEFPRQLVAARRARPRRAEGPLLEEAASIAAESPQLRIFEVEPTQISSIPAIDSSAPEWSSIMLGAQPLIEPTLVQPEEPAQLLNWSPATAPLLITAPLELRIMASAVDACIVLAAMLAFFAAAILPIGHLPALQLSSLSPLAIATQIAPFAAAAGLAFFILTALYQVLFFTFSDATPGMRYARIALCTFSDENPTRAQMRRRALTFLISALPCGLGLLWPWIDTDRLTWHDRLSRIYQRSY
jgi:hypothetical protein